MPSLPGGDSDSRLRQFMDTVSSAERTPSLLPVTLRLLGNLIAADHLVHSNKIFPRIMTASVYNIIVSEEFRKSRHRVNKANKTPSLSEIWRAQEARVSCPRLRLTHCHSGFCSLSRVPNRTHFPRG